MSYLVLARKWRPQTFDEVVGQQVITQTLRNALQQNRVAHALLFCGPRGVGKTSVARILAKALNCEKGPTPDPCGTCPACREIAQGTNLDIHEIDGASNNGVDEIRKLKETVAYLPVSVRYKVYIIDEVHMLSKGAFNALLKTLEEPPAHVIFILATTEPHKIPMTILSRCQRYDFRRVPFQEMVTHLKKIVEREGYSADEKALMLVAREATGSLRDAEVVLDQLLLISENNAITIEDARSVLSVVDSTIMMRVLDAILRQNAETLLTLIHEMVDAGTDLGYFFRSFLLFLHDLLLLKAAGDREIAMERSTEEISQMQRLIQNVPLEQIEQWIYILHERERLILQSEYARIGLETALIRMIHLNQAVSVATLIQRLENTLGDIPHQAAAPQPSEGDTFTTSGTAAPPSKTPSSEDQPAPSPSERNEPHQKTDDIFFRDFLSFVKKRAMALSVQLSEATGFRWNGSIAEISFPSQSFSLKLLQGTEKEDQIKKLLKEFSGREVAKVACVEGTSHPIPAEPRTSSTQSNIRDHPAVRDVLGVLGGRLVEIKPLDTSKKTKEEI